MQTASKTLGPRNSGRQRVIKRPRWRKFACLHRLIGGYSPSMDAAARQERSSGPTSDTTQRQHWPTLDGLRGIAVAMVLVTHLPSEPAAQIQRFLPQLMQMGGYLGVDLFFVLSGFLITRILLSDRERGVPLRFFLARRCLRIFPVYYLLLALNAVFAPDMALVWCATYLSNYYFAFVDDNSLLRHTWSLCVEEHFYMLWPLLAHRLAPRVSRRALFGLMGLSLASSAYFVAAQVPHAASLVYQGTLSRVWSLALGAMVAYSAWGSSARPPRWVIVACAGLGCSFAALAIVLGALRLTPPAYLAMVPGYSLLSLSALLASLASTPKDWLGRALTVAPLRYTGRISYGLYLFHPFAYRALMSPLGERMSLEFLGRAALGVAAAFIAATVSFYLFERHILKLKSHFVMPRLASSGAIRAAH